MHCMQTRCICGRWLPVRKRTKRKEKKRKTYCRGPTCWRADIDGGGTWMRVDTGVHASGCVGLRIGLMRIEADGFDVDTLWMGLMQIKADGFDADMLWMGLMQMRCRWV